MDDSTYRVALSLDEKAGATLHAQKTPKNRVRVDHGHSFGKSEPETLRQEGRNQMQADYISKIPHWQGIHVLS